MPRVFKEVPFLTGDELPTANNGVVSEFKGQLYLHHTSGKYFRSLEAGTTQWEQVFFGSTEELLTDPAFKGQLNYQIESQVVEKIETPGSDIDDALKVTMDEVVKAGPKPPLAPTSRVHSFDPELALYNPESPSVQRFRARTSYSQTLGRKQLVLMGHSYLAGSNSTPGVSDQGSRLKQALKRSLGNETRAGIAIFRNGEVRDTRYSAVSAGWGPSNGAILDPFGQTTTANDSFTFTSDDAGTVVDIYSFQNSYAFTYSIDGAAAVSVPRVDGQVLVRKTTITGLSNTTHTVTITATGAGASTPVYIIGVGVRQPAIGLEIFNFGYGGSTSSAWLISDSTNNTAKRRVATQVANERDMVILEIETNDVRAGVSAATWKSNLGTIINSHVSLGHAVLLTMSIDVVPGASFPAMTRELWDAYYTAAYELADQYDIPLFDTSFFFGSWDRIVANGFQGDTLHLNAAGWDAMARNISRIITS